MFYYIYRILNTLNNKIYIGLTNDYKHRWSQHLKCAQFPDRTKQYIHHAMHKHGVANFRFNVIATVFTEDDANEIEHQYIIDLKALDRKFGYNIKPGGARFGHAESTKEKLKIATIKQIENQGHPRLGKKLNEEQLATHSIAMKNRNIDYTPELRAKFSISNKGKCLEPEQQARRIEALRDAFKERKEQQLANEEWKCHAPDCDVSGYGKYHTHEGLRYCAKHGQRLKAHGTTTSVRNEIKATEIAEGKWKCHAPGCDHNNDKRYWIYNGLRYCSKHFYRLDTFGTTELPQKKPI